MGSINWPEFTPWTAGIGGAIIGFGSGPFHSLPDGRIMGVSSILSGLARPGKAISDGAFLF